MPSLNAVIEGIVRRLNAHKARHQDGGADEISLAGLTVASEDIDFTLNEYTSAQTLTADNYLVIVDASSGNITITLPASASHTNRIYTIKKIDSSQHKVTIDANSTETIDGEETIVLNLQYSYVTIICDGTEWWIIGGEYVKMEDILERIEDKLETFLEREAKALVTIDKVMRHLGGASTLEVDDDEVEKGLKDMMVEVED